MTAAARRWPVKAPAPTSSAPAPAPSAASAQRPTFSVVIPAYEVAEYVGDAVRSALEQTLAPLEVIVVDDGSPDDIAGALAPYLDRITLIRQQNQGPGAAKLAGATAARGDFVAFLDGDDCYLPERLEALADVAVSRPDLDILVTNAYVELRGERLRLVYDETWEFEVADQRRAIITRCFVLGHAAARRSLVVGLGQLDRATLDDWECWARLILGGARAGLVDVPLSCYRVRPGASRRTAPRSTARARRRSPRCATIPRSRRPSAACSTRPTPSGAACSPSRRRATRCAPATDGRDGCC